MKRLLTEAVAIGNGAARAISFRPRKPGVFFYEDRQWNSPFAGMSHEFMNNGERFLDDRIFFHYLATGFTPAIAAPQVGKGSVWGFTATDSEGRCRDGGKTYKADMPHPILANNFWSFMVYSTQHRSVLETDQKLAGLDSNNPAVKANSDGSYIIWLGPQPPTGQEGNWIQTMPAKGSCVLLRRRGSLKPWFDKTWKPGDLAHLE